MSRALVLLGLIALPMPALAQAVDWCGSPLPLQSDPGTVLVWRLRCTIQILDRERSEAVNHVTTAEADKAFAEARLKALELEAEKKGVPPPTVLPEKKEK